MCLILESVCTCLIIASVTLGCDHGYFSVLPVGLFEDV